MRQYFGLRAVLGVLVVGCAGQDVGGEATLGQTSQAVTSRAVQCRGDGSGHKPAPCSIKRDPAYALPIAACGSSRLVGAALNNAALSSDALYATTLANEFSYVTPENAMKWGTLQPVDATHWDFTDADAVVAEAKSAHQAIKGHTLIWYQQLPPFVTDTLSASDLKKAINRNIDKVVGRYKGDIRAWDVVNEAIADDGTLRDSVFSRAFGQDFIADAFNRAHAADPDAKLFYNDYGAEVQNVKSDAVYALVKQLLKKHVPIDGVGFQMHLDARSAPSEQALLDNFARFQALGLSVNISELDVQVANIIGTRAEKLALEKQIYHRVVAACTATPACEAVTTWGFTDKYSWIDSTFGPDDPLEFDDNIARKPAYYAMVDGFVGLEPDPDGTPPNLIPNSSFEAGTDGWFGFGIPSVTIGKRAHTGDRAGLATGRTDTWQGPAIDVTSLVRSGFIYDASAFVSIKHEKDDTVALSAKITCEGADATYTTVASDTAMKHEYTALDGTLTLPLCPLSEVILYVQGPAAGVDVLVDDVALREIGEPLGPDVITNSDFESGVTGWVAWAGTLAPSNVAHTGTGSAIVTNRTDTWNGPVYDLLPQVTDGATYKVSGFIRIAGAASAPVSETILSVCDGTQTYTSVATGTANDQGFVSLSGSYLVPPCDNLTQLSLYFEGPAAGIDEIVDDVTAQQRLSIPVVTPPPPAVKPNLAGNGDWELGTNGWFPFGGSLAQTTAFVHGGTEAGVATNRTASYMGPSYDLPAGPASYDASVYALQNSGGAITLALSAKVTCGGADSYLTVGSASAASGTWTKLAGTLTVPAGCTAAVAYVQQFDGATFPDLYVDDLVVNADSVTNFAADGGFENGTDGWFTFGGGLAQTTAFVHSGTYAGLNSGRSADYMGPAFSYPTGAGEYSASIFALQNSGSDLPFFLTAKMTCGGTDSYPTVASVTGPSGSWVQLSGTFTVPSNCTEVTVYLHQNGGSVFPDIYADDLVALPVTN
jgi:endo-1,4-beta-xylanase